MPPRAMHHPVTWATILIIGKDLFTKFPSGKSISEVHDLHVQADRFPEIVEKPFRYVLEQILRGAARDDELDSESAVRFLNTRLDAQTSPITALPPLSHHLRVRSSFPSIQQANSRGMSKRESLSLRKALPARAWAVQKTAACKEVS
ncbi:MAG: hypothetical protein P8182_10720 [Deltaproteobacteria bacterium]